MESTPRGRPRAFDADEALHQAMLLFWRRGYEGAGLTDLTEAMGISRKSLYAAFGNKENLFRLALQRYTDDPAGHVVPALQQPTAREVATAYLNGSVQAITRPGCPRGCLSVQAALTTGDTGQAAQQLLVEWRAELQTHLRDRFQQAITAGDLPSTADPDLLARYLITITNGLSIQAAGGATRAELQQVADAVLTSWPPH